MTTNAPDVPRSPDRRALVQAAAWSIPVVAATVATPLAAATPGQPAGNFSVSVTASRPNPNRPSWVAVFTVTPEPGVILPPGTVLVLEAIQVHSRSWFVISSQFDYVSTVVQDGNGNPASDSVNARYTASTYLTVGPFAAPHELQLTYVPWPGAQWEMRITAQLPPGYTAGPNAVLTASFPS